MGQRIGLDISDSSVEVVSLRKGRGGIFIERAGRRALPAGLVIRGVIQDPDRLAGIVSSLLAETFGKKWRGLRVGLALPETAIYSRIFSLPVRLSREMALKALALESRKHFPVAVKSAASDLVRLDAGEETQEVLYLVAEKEVARGYGELLERLGLKAQFYDAESMALCRALVGERSGPVLVADIGAKTSLLVIREPEGVRFSSNVGIAGDDLTAALESRLRTSFEQAERIKKDNGFDTDAEDGRALLILQEPMSRLIAAIQETLDYHERRTGRKVTEVILAGGTSLTPSIAEYISSNLSGVTVSLGNPLVGMTEASGVKVEELRNQRILFATAIGLALRAAGLREDPGVDLDPSADRSDRRGARLTGAIRSIFNSLMPTTRKKKTPKKPAKKTPKKAKEVEEEKKGKPQAAEAPAAAPEVKPEVKEEPQTPEPVAETVEEAAPVVTPPTPEEEEAVEHLKYGRGVGDILEMPEDMEEATDGESEGGSAVSGISGGGERLSVEAILKGQIPEEEIPKPVEKKVKPVKERRVRKGSRRVTPLALVLVILVGIAAAGVFMFLEKNEMATMPDSVSGLWSGWWSKDTAETPPGGEVTGPTAPTSVSVVFVVSVDEQPAGERPVLLSRMVETDVSLDQTFDATGAMPAPEARAGGTVTIINETPNSYTFVATTRFLSPDSKLFRLKEATAIPADGTVEAEVYADGLGPEFDIGPTTFTIPGLSESLQEVIYGESSRAMTGGAGTVTAVSTEDIESAKRQMAEALKGEAEENIKAMLTPGERMLQDLITSSELEVNAPEADTPTSRFLVEATFRFRALLIPEELVEVLLLDRLESVVPEGESVADYELGSLLYTVEAYDTVTERAEVRVEAPLR